MSVSYGGCSPTVSIELVIDFSNMTITQRDEPKPHRVQLRRTRGWRKGPNTVVVSRPSKWGNPFRAGWGIYMGVPICTNADAVAAYKKHIERMRDLPGLDLQGLFRIEDIRTQLRGKNLACWCDLDQPCHADILLEIANS